MNKNDYKLIATAIDNTIELLEACPRKLFIEDIKRAMIDSFIVQIEKDLWRKSIMRKLKRKKRR